MWSPKGKLKSVNSQPSKKKKRIMKGPPLPGNIDPGRKGGGGTPYNGPYGEALPERGTFSGFSYIKG